MAKKEKEYEVMPEDYARYDLSFKRVVIGNSGKIKIYKLYINYISKKYIF